MISDRLKELLRAVFAHTPITKLRSFTYDKMFLIIALDDDPELRDWLSNIRENEELQMLTGSGLEDLLVALVDKKDYSKPLPVILRKLLLELRVRRMRNPGSFTFLESQWPGE